MKIVTVSEVEGNFTALLRLVEAGEEVQIVKRKRTVARIVPAEGNDLKADWSGVTERLRAASKGKHASGKPASQIVREGRR